MAELTKVHDPVNSAGKPRIVFIHGLDGDLSATWMSNRKDVSTLWPSWLGEDTGCPVWLLGYGSAMSRWRADAMPLPQQATAVLQRLSIEQSLLDGPLVLVGHSLGGLVIKTALNQGLGRDVERHGRLARNIKGIAFVGTPHFGSTWASIAAYTHLMRPNPQVSDLRMDNAYLEELNQYFLKHCRELNLKTRVFTETQPVRLPSWLGGRFLPGVTIVSPTSSQAHIPGEVGLPIEADHISICKPLNRNADIYTSMRDFIGEIEAGTHLHQPLSLDVLGPLPSDRFDAMRPEDRPPDTVHLAFSAYGFKLAGDAEVPVCASVCLVTDEPDRLRKALQEMRYAVGRDPLVPESAKKISASASLEQLIQYPGARGVMLRMLAITSFSAYLYYCPRNSFGQLPSQVRLERLFIAPLRHRMSKKSEHIEQYHTRQIGMFQYLKDAAAGVEQAYRRVPALPRVGAPKYAVLEELASVIVSASCTHLGDLADGNAAELFECLRTRIRYAENVATGEKHKRDVNPLP
jgi:pimeloyl-ACP methyl ester carboxylesterase